MNVLLFGATGMVGDGVLHECLADARVASVLAAAEALAAAAGYRARVLENPDINLVAGAA
jgi:hypothetical protein